MPAGVSGRQSRRAVRVPATWWEWIVAAVAVWLVLWPLVQVAGKSLGLPGSPSVLAFRRVFMESGVLRSSVSNSLVVSAASATVACLIGTVLAFIVGRTDVPLRGLLVMTGSVSFMMPPFIGSVAWVLLCDRTVGLINRLLTVMRLPPVDIYSYGGLVFVSALYTTPYVFNAVSASLQSMNPELEEAGIMGGMSPLQVGARITVPLMMPAVLSGALLAFVQSMVMFGVHGVLGMPKGIYLLTTAIWRQMNAYPPRAGDAAALSIVLFFLCMLAILLQRRVLGVRTFTTVSGKGLRPRRVSLGPWGLVAAGIGVAYVGAAIILPVLALLLRALQSVPGALSLGSLSWSNFSYILGGYDLTKRALRNSLFLACAGATVCVILGSLVAYISERRKGALPSALRAISLLPLAAPGTVLAVGLLLAYMRPPLRLYGTAAILLVAYVTRELPVAVSIMGPGVVQIHSELEESGRVAGIGTAGIWARILIPLLLQHLIAAWVLLFPAMFREISASMLLYSPGNEVFATALYDQLQMGALGPAATLALVGLAIVFSVTVAVRRAFSGLVRFGGAQ